MCKQARRHCTDFMLLFSDNHEILAHIGQCDLKGPIW